MLPTAHLIPSEILSDTLDGATRVVQLSCFEELLPLRESGPGYLAFWPQIEPLPESFAELDWHALLAADFRSEELLLPRSSLHRLMTPEGQLQGFPLGDVFDLEPMAHAVDWSDGEHLVLTLRQPVTIAELLGPEPPELPEYRLCKVAYELLEEQAVERFGEGARQIAGIHWRYVCWALESWPRAYADQLPTLPHLAPAEEPFDAVESFLVFDEEPFARAMAGGWRFSGRVWTNPATGSMEEGAVYAGFAPASLGRARCEWLHFHLAGTVVTALVPFHFTAADPSALVHRWVSNEPFPQLLEEPG